MVAVMRCVLLFPTMARLAPAFGCHLCFALACQAKYSVDLFVSIFSFSDVVNHHLLVKVEQGRAIPTSTWTHIFPAKTQVSTWSAFSLLFPIRDNPLHRPLPRTDKGLRFPRNDSAATPNYPPASLDDLILYNRTRVPTASYTHTIPTQHRRHRLHRYHHLVLFMLLDDLRIQYAQTSRGFTIPTS